jgi:hypothetical protein
MRPSPELLRAARELDTAIALGHHEAVPNLRHRLDLEVARALDGVSPAERRSLLAAWRDATRVLDEPAHGACPWRRRHD